MEKKYIIYLLALSLVLACIGNPQKEQEKSTTYLCHDCNVILLTVECLRADHTSYLGYFRNTTPHLDKFGRENTFFENAYVSSSWTLPSVSSVITGFYPHEHGVIKENTALEKDFKTLAEYLKEDGYSTYQFFNGWFPPDKLYLDQGFDESVVDLDGKTFVNMSLQRLKEKKGKKFIWIHMVEPHLQYNPGRDYENLFIDNPPEDVKNGFRRDCMRENITEDEKKAYEALYDAEIRYVDDAFGMLVKGLKNQDIYDNTIIVVLGDHGEEFWEHGGCDHGQSLYEELTHVPLAMRIPDYEGKTKVETQVSTVGITPTILDILDIGYETTGESLMDILEGKVGEKPVYTEASHPKFSQQQKAIRYKGKKTHPFPKGQKSPRKVGILQPRG